MFATWRVASTRAGWDDEEQPWGAGVQEEHHDGLQGQPSYASSSLSLLYSFHWLHRMKFIPTIRLIHIMPKIIIFAVQGGRWGARQRWEKVTGTLCLPSRGKYHTISWYHTFLGYLQSYCWKVSSNCSYKWHIQVAGTDLPRSLQEKLENERNIVISIWRLSPR